MAQGRSTSFSLSFEDERPFWKTLTSSRPSFEALGGALGAFLLRSTEALACSEALEGRSEAARMLWEQIRLMAGLVRRWQVGRRASSKGICGGECQWRAQIRGSFR